MSEFDLVCKAPSSYFPPDETSVSVPPVKVPEEELVCKDPNLSRDNLSTKVNSGGIAASQINFIDNENKVCKISEEKEVKPVKKNKHGSNKKTESQKFPEDINMCIDPNMLMSKEKEHISSELFTATLDNSKIVMDLDVELQDNNGFNNLGKDDISGKVSNGKIEVNHELFDTAIYGLKGFKSKDGSRTTVVNNVTFDKSEKSYVLDIKVTQNAWKLDVPLLWDNFQVKFKVDNNGQLIAKLDKNWIFDSLILNKLEGIVRDKIKNTVPEDFRNFTIDVKKGDGQLTLVPDVNNLEVPVSDKGSVTINHIDGEKAKFNIDENGNLKINLKDVTLKGSTSLGQNAPIPAPNSSEPDFAKVNVKLGLGKDNSRQVYARGKIGINLDETETSKVKIGGESLGNYFSSGKILDDFSVYSNRKSPSENPNIQSKNYVYVQDAKIGDQKVDLETSMQLTFDPKEGIKLDSIEVDDSPVKLHTSKNGVEFFVNGSQYFPEMQKMIKEAKESVNLETYMLHNDPSGKKAIYMLVKKAAGLSPEENKVMFSPENPNGIRVNVMFNSWKGNIDAGKESEKIITDTISKVKEEINASKMSAKQKENAIKALDDNMKWKFFTDGILRSDHRKVFVVDGNQATVGGMNMGSQYLSEDAYHDVMLKFAGPEVRRVQKEFYENWFEFNNMEQPTEGEWKKLLKPRNELENDLAEFQKKGKYKNTSEMGTLVTDDHQTDINKGIIKLIDEAKSEINIEQAFFSDSNINKHLSEAIKRGVKVNVIVAKHSIINLFDAANLNSVNELLKVKKQGAKGDIKLYYYDKPGNDSKFIHTKAISTDGEKAIIGSANMIGRSLDSPFTKISPDGEKSQALYNKELSMYVNDRKTVQEINSRLFETDMVNNTKEVTPAEIDKLVKDMGGEEELKKKALMAKFT